MYKPKFSAEVLMLVETLKKAEVKNPSLLEEIFLPLDEREEDILKLRFGININYPRTLEEVGQRYNLTRERIRQIESRALQKIREYSGYKKLYEKLNLKSKS